MKNIPDAGESWLQAEQMLDRHFRRKRILTWLLVLLVPAVVGLATYTYFANTAKVPQNKVAVNSSETTGIETQVTGNNTISTNPAASSNEKTESVSGSNLSSSGSSSNAGSNSSARLSDINDKNNLNVNNSRSDLTGPSADNSSAVTLSSQPKVSNKASLNSKAESANRRKSSVNNNPSGKIVTGGVVINSTQKPDNIPSSANDNISLSQSSGDRSEIFAMNEIRPEITVPVQSSDLKSTAFNPSGKYKSGHISFQASIYGGFNYVSKTLSASDEWQNYLQHRENEEENIITPAIGLSLTASMSKLSVSLGAEYSVYGEETNYYPYSLQKSVVQNGYWNFYSVAYTDTDTAYVIGNQYFLESQQIRADSSYIANIDTVEEYKYDQAIAEKNGVNRITYIEMPVMISYNLVSGRAGVGVSAGIAPGWLTSRSGYYLRTDGKGVESLQEIQAFRKFMMNGRVGIDLYYRMSARMCFTLRPQIKANLNSVFEDNYGVKQKYTSTGVLFGVSWLLN